MKFRTLLLGTAAAFAVAGTAHAADLAVAESVDYVKVCDAYGAGYWYVPGSDVCLHIGGYVLFDTYFHDGKYLNFPQNAGDIPGTVHSTTGGALALNTGGPSGYHASWHFYEENELDVDAKWMTDLGAATIHMALRNNNDPSTFAGSEGVGNGNTAGNGRDGGFGYVDTVYFKVGGLKAGWDASTFDGGKFYGLYGWESPFDHDRHQDQIQWSTTAGGWGFFLAVEDPRQNTGGSEYYNGGWPDIVAAVSGSLTSAFSWRWSAAATDTNYGTGWGTEFDIRWQGVRGIEGGTGMSFQGAVGNSAGAGYAANWNPNGNGGTPWHVTFQGGIAWTHAFTTLLGVSFREQGGTSEKEVSAEGDWAVTKGFETGIAASWDDLNGASTTQVVMRGKASF